MSISWNTELNVSLRRILLSLTNGKSLNLVCIAKELNIEKLDHKDKELLKRKMRSLAKEDDDLKFLAYLRGKYLIVENSNDMGCLYLRYNSTSKTYAKKASIWLDASKTAKNTSNFEQMEIQTDIQKEGTNE